MQFKETGFAQEHEDNNTDFLDLFETAKAIEKIYLTYSALPPAAPSSADSGSGPYTSSTSARSFRSEARNNHHDLLQVVSDVMVIEVLR